MAVDLYGRPFNFRMMNGYTTHRSIIGSLLSLLLFSITLVYFIDRLDTLTSYGEQRLSLWEKNDVLDHTFEFDAEQFDFKFAYGLFSNAYSAFTDSEEDDDYGHFWTYHLNYGNVGALDFNKFGVRSCEMEDLIDSTTTVDHGNLPLRKLVPNLKCFDRKDYVLAGSVESRAGSTINLTFLRCNPQRRSTCKSEEEFNKWILDKSIVIVHSEQ